MSMNNLFENKFKELMLSKNINIKESLKEAVYIPNIDDTSFDYVDTCYIIIDTIEQFYKWEYIYYRIKFSLNDVVEDTVPYRRRINVMKQILKSIGDTHETIANWLIETYDKWLYSHAITDPETWAIRRMEDDNQESKLNYESFETILELAIYEYERYANPNKRWNDSETINQLMIQIIDDRNIDRDLIYDMLKWINLDPYIEWRISDIKKLIEEEGEDPEDYEEELKELDYLSSREDGKRKAQYIYNYGLYEILDFIKENSYEDPEEFLIALYRIVFEYWYDYWSPQGIDETRERAEQYRKLLTYIKNPAKDEEDFKLNITILHKALNNYHQTGSMLDYDPCDQISKLDLDSWSNDEKWADQWDKDIAKIIGAGWK
jgi:hypothetical protein